MTATWTESEIAAFVDGELTSADADRIARVLVTDADARAIADRIRATNDVLKSAFSAPMGEQIPDAIFRTVAEPDRGGAGPSDRPATVTPLRRHRDRPRDAGRRRWMPMALAAGIALVVGVGTGGVMWPEPSAPLTSGDAPTGGTLHAALETLPEWDPVGRRHPTDDDVCRCRWKICAGNSKRPVSCRTSWVSVSPAGRRRTSGMSRSWSRRRWYRHRTILKAPIARRSSPADRGPTPWMRCSTPSVPARA